MLSYRAATGLWQPLTGPAGQEIKKQPLAEIPWPMSGDQTTAVTAGSNLHRRLRPIIRTVAAPRLNSRSGRFAIKSPTFSDVGNAHEAAGRRGHSDWLVMAECCG